MKKTIAILALIATGFVTKAQNIEIKTNAIWNGCWCLQHNGGICLPNYGNRTLLVSAMVQHGRISRLVYIQIEMVDWLMRLASVLQPS